MNGTSLKELDRILFVTRHFNELQGLWCSLPLGLNMLGLGLLRFYPVLPLLVLQLVLSVASIALIARMRPYYRRRFGEVERSMAGPAGQLQPVSIYNPAVAAPRLEPRDGRWRQFLVILGVVVTCFLILRAVSPAAEILTDSSARDPWLQLNPPVVEIPADSNSHGMSFTLESTLTQVFYLLFGAVFLATWFQRERRQSQIHFLLFGVLLLGLAALGASLGLVLGEAWNAGSARLVGVFLPALAHLWMAEILCGLALISAGLFDHWQLARALGPAVEEPS
jgi:hypothetical protein